MRILKKYNVHPYQRASNLAAYVEDKMERLCVGLIGGKVLFQGKFMTEEEFKAIPPIELIITAEHLDGTQVI